MSAQADEGWWGYYMILHREDEERRGELWFSISERRKKRAGRKKGERCRGFFLSQGGRRRGRGRKKGKGCRHFFCLVEGEEEGGEGDYPLGGTWAPMVGTTTARLARGGQLQEPDSGIQSRSNGWGGRRGWRGEDDCGDMEARWWHRGRSSGWGGWRGEVDYCNARTIWWHCSRWGQRSGWPTRPVARERWPGDSLVSFVLARAKR